MMASGLLILIWRAAVALLGDMETGELTQVVVGDLFEVLMETSDML
jgi:hypothetical protein